MNKQSDGIIEVDIHGMTRYQAKVTIESTIKKVKSNVYRIRIIHGFHNGTQLQNMVRKEFRNNPKVIRTEVGLNQGITDLVLRDLY